MTPEELEAWFHRHREPAVPLDGVPDREALAELIVRERAIVWPSPSGELYAASLISRATARGKKHSNRRVQVETDAENEYGRLDLMPSWSSDAADPGLVADLAERAGQLVRGWERMGGRRAPWPVILYGGRQAWPPEGFAIRPRKVGKRNRRIAVPDMVQETPACSVCRGAVLSAVTACLACGRWGLDHLLTRERAAEAVAAETIRFRPRTKRGKTG